jgi:hypothetical protein
MSIYGEFYNCFNLAIEFTFCHQNAASQMVLNLVWKRSRTIVECFYLLPKSEDIWKHSQHSTPPPSVARGTGEDADGSGLNREGGRPGASSATGGLAT